MVSRVPHPTRLVLYQQGGVFCITTRILVVDLLTNIAKSKDIEGMLVAHAENVTEQSTEAFILRIFQTQKQFASQDGANKGFVKAFSEAPDVLLSGFAKVDKVMKALYVRRLFLYPRFHSTIADELERRPPHVDELHQQLSPKMKDIQNAIAAAVQTCIRELKASTKLLEWKDEELSVENCVTQNFDRAISRQLEGDWHRLKPQTKQLVQDLRTLRTLFLYLIHYDCVAFWKLINSIKTISAASRHPSMWLLTPAADMLFRKAKERLYTLIKPKATKKVPNPVAKLKPVLEENPKWRLLRHIIKEIHEDYSKKTKTLGPVNVLIMVKDERTVADVRSYLVDGRQKAMTMRWLRYLEGYNDRSRSVTKNAGGTSAISEESRLLLEEEQRARQLLFGRNTRKAAAGTKRKTLNQVPDYMRKHRKVASEKGRGKETRQTEDLERRAVLDEALEETEHDLGGTLPRMKERSGHDEDDDESKWFEVHEPSELRLVVKSYLSIDGAQANLLLEDLDPAYVILSDADISFVRAIEIHSSLQPQDQERIRVFFMLFEASAEEKTFRKALEREQNAFERLIHHKKIMAPIMNTLAGTTQEMQQAMTSGGATGSYAGGTLPLAMDSRTGRGKARNDTEKRDIAVDVREFRSALPSILHQGGMRLAPVTLIVGDFVLSSVHCVERKSISDLFGSFASGRLYTQAESMSKYYKCPCLLIEFDPSKSFCLQNSNELGIEIRTDSVCSKMVLLTTHFPKLRLLWSRSPHETLRVFKELKQNHDEVDVDKAMEIGRSESVEDFLQEGEDDEDEINETARDMLLRLPGVNVHNARKIMERCDSIAELAQMPRDELKRIAGPVTGQKLFTFFRQKVGAT
jgi:DNA excision repair protein ERCC-4